MRLPLLGVNCERLINSGLFIALRYSCRLFIAFIPLSLCHFATFKQTVHCPLLSSSPFLRYNHHPFTGGYNLYVRIAFYVKQMPVSRNNERSIIFSGKSQKHIVKRI